MPTDRDVALVKAGLEAAASLLDDWAATRDCADRKERVEHDILRKLASRLRGDALDPIAIAATVMEQRLCLVCGRNGPCEDAPDACTFDPTPQELYDDNCRLRKELAALRQRNAEHEQFRHQHRDCDKIAVENHALRARVEELEQDRDAWMLLGKSKPLPMDGCPAYCDTGRKLAEQVAELTMALADVTNECIAESKERLVQLRRTEKLRDVLQHLVSAYQHKHSPQHRAAALNHAQCVLKEEHDPR